MSQDEISASSRACVLKGETRTWTNKLRNADHCRSAYLISRLTPAQMKFSVRTATSSGARHLGDGETIAKSAPQRG